MTNAYKHNYLQIWNDGDLQFQDESANAAVVILTS